MNIRQRVVERIAKLLEEYYLAQGEKEAHTLALTKAQAFYSRFSSLMPWVFIHTFVTSVVFVFLSLGILIPTCGFLILNPDSPSVVKVIATVIVGYEVVTLVPVIPLSGWSGLMRLTYLYILFVRGRKGEPLLRAAWVATSLDGGWTLTPFVVLLAENAGEEFYEAIGWKTDQLLSRLGFRRKVK